MVERWNLGSNSREAAAMLVGIKMSPVMSARSSGRIRQVWRWSNLAKVRAVRPVGEVSVSDIRWPSREFGEGGKGGCEAPEMAVFAVCR